MTINLLEKASKNELIPTGAKPKLPIKITGLNEDNLHVYKIPLEFLYYNNENGRISTAVSRLDKNIEPTYEHVNPEYNKQIELMIIEDNNPALKRTKKSIKKNGQQVFGYVLQDGRVIDGNRRFTALRQLQRESGETHYFEAVVLPSTYDNKASRQEIKKLELQIQMGIEERESYDPVDLAVDVYQTVEINKIMTVQDYSRESGIRMNEINNRIGTVLLMRDYLEFINAKKNYFHIIKDAQMYNAFYELSKKLNRLYPQKGPRYEEIKEASFGFLTKILGTGGKVVFDSRDYLKNFIGTSYVEEFSDKTFDSVEELRDNLEEKPISSIVDLREVLEDSQTSLRQINAVYKEVDNKQNRGKNVEAFISQIKQSKDLFDDMKTGSGLTGVLSFSNFSDEQLSEIREYLISIQVATRELIKIYEEEI